MRRYIASDFHNGNEVTDYSRVMSFLDLVDSDADEFLILGDWLELFFSNLNIVTTVSPYKDIIQKVRAIASKKPTKLILGNHSWNLGLFKSYIEPVQIVTPFSENGVYYTHGYSEFDWLSFYVGTPVDPIYWQVAFPFVFPWAFPIWLATRVWAKAEDTYYWGIALIHERARSYAVKKGYHTIVFGHTHYPVDEVRGGIRLINVGDALDSYSYAIEEDGNIKLGYF